MVRKIEGFGESESSADHYDIYKGCFVHIQGENWRVYGILKNINRKNKYLEIQPSVLQNPDGITLSIIRDKSTTIELPICVIRPISNYSIEDYVNEYNKNALEESLIRRRGNKS